MNDPTTKLVLVREWRWRWMQRWGEDAILHRVTYAVSLEDEQWVGFRGVETACGLRLPSMHMPGILSRMYAPRCWRCCRALSIPEGRGAPFNSKHPWRSK